MCGTHTHKQTNKQTHTHTHKHTHTQAAAAGTRFTCFTGTKVQNTDAEAAAPADPHAGSARSAGRITEALQTAHPQPAGGQSNHAESQTDVESLVHSLSCTLKP